MGKYFGTDGFRGKAGEGLTADHAYQIGRFLGWYFGRTHRAQIVVGKDTRRSSYMLEYAISAGMAAPALTSTCSMSPPLPLSPTWPVPTALTAA